MPSVDTATTYYRFSILLKHTNLPAHTLNALLATQELLFGSSSITQPRYLRLTGQQVDTEPDLLFSTVHICNKLWAKNKDKKKKITGE